MRRGPQAPGESFARGAFSPGRQLFVGDVLRRDEGFRESQGLLGKDRADLAPSCFFSGRARAARFAEFGLPGRHRLSASGFRSRSLRMAVPRTPRGNVSQPAAIRGTTKARAPRARAGQGPRRRGSVCIAESLLNKNQFPGRDESACRLPGYATFRSARGGSAEPPRPAAKERG